MIALLSGALAPFWGWIAGAVAALAGITTIYLKGRADAAAKAKVKDLQNANEIRKAGADARNASDASGLRDSDGFKRD